MAWAERGGLAAKNSANSGGPATVTLLGATTIDDVIFVKISAWSATLSTTIGVPTATGLTFSLINDTEKVNGADHLRQAVYSAPVVSSSTPAISSTLTNASAWEICAGPYSGLSTVAADVDVQVHATYNSSTTNMTSTATTATHAANELVLGFYTDDGSNTAITASGQTALINDSPNAIDTGVIADADSGSSGTTPAALFTAGAAQNAVVLCVVYKLAAVAASPTAPVIWKYVPRLVGPTARAYHRFQHIPPAANITVALTGVLATMSTGTLSPSISAPLGGVLATGSTGTLAPSTTVSISNTGATASVGSLTPSTTIGLVGALITGFAGTVVATGGGAVAVVARIFGRRGYAQTVNVNPPYGDDDDT